MPTGNFNTQKIIDFQPEMQILFAVTLESYRIFNDGKNTYTFYVYAQESDFTLMRVQIATICQWGEFASRDTGYDLGYDCVYILVKTHEFHEDYKFEHGQYLQLKCA